MTQIAGHPYWQVTFDKNGGVVGATADQVTDTLAGGGIDHLFVFAHGWNENADSAVGLYQAMFGLVGAAAATQQGLGSIGFLGVIWPSIWFPDPPSGQATTVAAATAAGKPGVADAAVTGAQIAAALAPAYDDPATKAAIATMGTLVDQGLAGVAAGNVPDATQQANVAAFHDHLQALVPDPTSAAFDSGEAALLQAPDGQVAYGTIADVMGSTPAAGQAQGLGDIFGKVWNGAKDALRVASYLEMKSRAGTVGQQGLGPLLASLQQKAPTVKVHLMGHSFGARLAAFTLSGIPSAAQSPVGSVTLIQGAFSHWAFADATMPYGQAGPLLGYRDRVHGPVLSTFSKFDYAVGVWYPKASFLADDLVNAVEIASKWGGMGSDGAQCVPGPDPITLGASGQAYGLQAGEFYRFDGNAVIKDTSSGPFSGAHSDIRHDQVAWLPVCAAAGL